MWPSLREAGREAEVRMFEATRSVNTHKGEIFSLGLLCGCAGWQLGRGEALSAEKLTALTAEMCHGLCKKELGSFKKDEELQTKGERVYRRYGCTGIRGEAESGFRTVMEVSLPVFRKLMAKDVPVNDALVQTFLPLIARTADTNILSRHNMETAEYARARAREAGK
ncbi:MAG: triphosphoribosyl-dephospho-CoA synthase [Fretibacterium sp.]|nr:triphosphoribosyl-dephospho-CoA synthase [Fretibacterium sp.]